MMFIEEKSHLEKQFDIENPVYVCGRILLSNLSLLLINTIDY